MKTYLDDILAHHRALSEADPRDPSQLLQLALEAPSPPSLKEALRKGTMLAVIAEVKKRSPSKGDLGGHVVVDVLGKSYEQGGAAAVSVLTDETYFGGSLDDLSTVSQAISLPILRKDFTVSVNDVYDARRHGASAVLLIVNALSDEELRVLSNASDQCGLDVIFEVHDRAEIDRAVGCGAGIIGVNQRDLVTFEVDTDRALGVVDEIPEHIIRVAESGISSPNQAKFLAQGGYDAVLVGEMLVRSPDPVASVGALATIAKHPRRIRSSC